ncbi:hypothetical protein ACLOAV_010487 [Pseudogymnoascus australis]
MAVVLPSRLLGIVDNEFRVFDPRSKGAPVVSAFDIISHTWNDPWPKYKCGIPGVDWDLTIDPKKIDEIKKLMAQKNVLQFIWVDCLCLNQADADEKSAEIAKMYEYYRSASTCHILIDMKEVWNPQEVVDNLKFIDHIRTNIHSTSLASEANLTANIKNRLSMWENEADWVFPLDEATVRSAAIEMGVLNCYSTCIGYVKSLFTNFYFTRVWTFEEMLLGKNITLWGIQDMRMSCIGQLGTWMDLAIDSVDKAAKLSDWIEEGRVLNTSSIDAILGKIDEDVQYLATLRRQVCGIQGARTDIISGGPRWWHDNHQGIYNVFSAVSIIPRTCYRRGDIFKGLLGVFNGLFTAEEIKTKMKGDDMESLSFEFFKQLSIKTRGAWSRLVITSGERERWDWIPVVANPNSLLTTDCFAGVVRLGHLGKDLNGSAKAIAMTGLEGTPQKYMRIVLNENNGAKGDFNFVFKGCNCGKEVKSGRFFSTEPIPTNDHPIDVAGDETGRILVQCATILGSIMDPGNNVVDYRERLLSNLRPRWLTTDPSAKPKNWTRRCVSGTFWEDPEQHPSYRVHNMSTNYRMKVQCASRLDNASTSSLSCEVRVDCGCTIVAPFPFVFEAITAIYGSSLGQTTAQQGNEGRIVLHDGMGLVQVGDVGKAFDLVAFGGDVDAYRTHAHSCRNTKINKHVMPKGEFPRGRALVRAEFTHGVTDVLRDYGYVPTGDEYRQNTGSGNLLIFRKRLFGRYKIIGVCIDDWIQHKDGGSRVTIQ